MSEAQERPAIVDFSDSERLKAWAWSPGFEGFVETGAVLESSPELEQEIKMRAERKSKIILYKCTPPPKKFGTIGCFCHGWLLFYMELSIQQGAGICKFLNINLLFWAFITKFIP